MLQLRGERMDKSGVILILLIILLTCILLYLIIVLKELNSKKKKYYVKEKTKKEQIKNIVVENKKIEETKTDNHINDFNKANKQEGNDEYNFPELEEYQAYAFSRSGAYHAKQRNHQNLLDQQYLNDKLKNDL